MADLPTVTDQDGVEHTVGLNTTKDKLFNERGEQITKSCHICQNQHVFWHCGKGCGVSYCERCARYCGFTVAQCISTGCPKCNSSCVCNKCLKRNGFGHIATTALPHRLELLKQGPPPPEEMGGSGSTSASPRPPARQLRKRSAPVSSYAGTAGPAAPKEQLSRPKKKKGRPRKRSADELDDEGQQNRAPAEQGQTNPQGSFVHAANVVMGNQGPQNVDVNGGKEVEGHMDKNKATKTHGANKTPKAREPVVIIIAQVGEDGKVTGEGGVKYTIGQPLGKKRARDQNGMQISKSCHQCQDQHIAFACKSGKEGCKASYCKRCCDRYYPDVPYEDIMEKCPRCRGFCNCRGCLRYQWDPVFPERSQAMAQNLAEHVLRCTGGHIKDILDLYDTEVGYDGITLEDVEVEPAMINRINCDRCCTSIPDLFRSCQNCGIDLCIGCCKIWRAGSKEVLCRKCCAPMKPKKLLKLDMLEDLRAIVKDYGDCRVTQSGPSWSSNVEKMEESTGNGNSGPSTCGGVDRGHWTQRVDSSMVRVCSTHPDAEKKYIFCPTSADLKNSDELHQVFQECMRRGEPVIVRNVKGVMDWRPETMCRAVLEKGNKAAGVGAKEAELTVIDCTNRWQESFQSQKSFFSGYQSKEAPKAMLKIKDWPPEENFRDRLKRHNQDFIEMLPMKEYTNPLWGALNMCRALPERCLPPDLGPKAYIALGRTKEHRGEGDSVTKLHLDMSDAINVLLHSYSHPQANTEHKVRLGDELWEVPSYGNAGAVWDLVRREDVDKVSEYLIASQDNFVHGGDTIRRLQVQNPIMEQVFHLRSEDRVALEKSCGVHLWHLEQHVNEAIYIPAGVPHQVRNLKNCIKVAVDFVPPESFGQILHLAKKLQYLGCCGDDAGLDKLQGVAMMLYAAREAYEIKSGTLDAFVIKKPPEPRRTNKRAPKRRKKTMKELEDDHADPNDMEQ